MKDKRINRISEEVRRVISEIILNEIKDPRISPITSVSHVDVTRDLSFAKVYISVLGNEEEKVNTLAGLESAKGYIKKELGRRIKLRAMPDLILIMDDSIERSMEMNKLINEVNHD